MKRAVDPATREACDAAVRRCFARSTIPAVMALPASEIDRLTAQAVEQMVDRGVYLDTDGGIVLLPASTH